MTDLEPLLRSHFEAEARAAITDADLIAPVLRGRRQRRRRAVGSAVVLLLLTAFAVPFAAHLGDRSQVRAAAPSSSAPTPPAGTRAVVWGGIELDVPASWGTNETRCGTPVADTVVYADGPTTSCAMPPTPVFSSLSLKSGDATGEFDTVVPLPPVTFAGLPARRGSVRDGRLVTVVTVVPSRGVSIDVTTNSTTAAGEILDTARTVVRDAEGCPVLRSAVATAVPPGVLCAYLGDWLGPSARLSTEQQDSLTALVPTADGPRLQPLVETRGTPTDGCLRAVLGVRGLGALEITENGCSSPAGIFGAATAPLSPALRQTLVALLPTGFRVG